MHTFHCDGCGKPTYVYPPTEQVYEEREVPVMVPDIVESEGKSTIVYRERRVLQNVPATTTMRRQHPHTGKIEDVQVPLTKDLKPRVYMVRLNAGAESIQRDFCFDCLQKHMKKIKALWDDLAKVEPRE